MTKSGRLTVSWPRASATPSPVFTPGTAGKNIWSAIGPIIVASTRVANNSRPGRACREACVSESVMPRPVRAALRDEVS